MLGDVPSEPTSYYMPTSFIVGGKFFHVDKDIKSIINYLDEQQVPYKSITKSKQVYGEYKPVEYVIEYDIPGCIFPYMQYYFYSGDLLYTEPKTLITSKNIFSSTRKKQFNILRRLEGKYVAGSQSWYKFLTNHPLYYGKINDATLLNIKASFTCPIEIRETFDKQKGSMVKEYVFRSTDVIKYGTNPSRGIDNVHKYASFKENETVLFYRKGGNVVGAGGSILQIATDMAKDFKQHVK